VSEKNTDTMEQVLVAIRRVIRATDLHSKQITRVAGLTSSQLVLLSTIRDQGSITAGEIAQKISLSQATVTSILDRLEAKGLVERSRDSQDKRRVYVSLTGQGVNTLNEAPAPLQETFIRQFRELHDWEQSMILASLQRVAHMMDAADLDASPLLDVGSLDRS
jgi:DNA-binding MarR family transcriptional regulator